MQLAPSAASQSRLTRLVRFCPRCLAAGAFSNDKVPTAESSSLDPDSTVHIVIPEESGLPAGAPHKLGEYELVEEIAAGGMGVVYKAWQPGLERFVAVKTIRSGLLATSADVERFQREAHRTTHEAGACTRELNRSSYA